MSSRRWTLIAILVCALLALGWNPAIRRDGGPLRWNTLNPIIWNPDKGKLGKLNSVQAIQMVQDSFDEWQAVATSTLAYLEGPLIVDGSGGTVDVTSANYSEVINLDNGQNPIIFDNDREIFDLLGIPSAVVGFGGILRSSPAAGRITKAYAVFEGDWFDNDAGDVGETSEIRFRGMMVHQIGHFNGLGHSSVNHELTAGIDGCPLPTTDQLETMGPFDHDGSLTLHFDDATGASVLYPTGAFITGNSKITGHLIDASGSGGFDGGNMVLRPVTADCNLLYNNSQATQSGVNPGEDGGAGSYAFSGLTPRTPYTLQVTTINDGGDYPIGGTAPPFVPAEFFNGFDENFFNPPDDPTMSGPINSPSAGGTFINVDVKINNAGFPGEIASTGEDALTLGKLDGQTPLDPESLILDDDGFDTLLGFQDTAQMAWVNRFSPAADQFPFELRRIDILFSSATISAGRPIRLLVYVDPAGTGTPANASLVYSEDTAIQMLDAQLFNEYTLSTPVSIVSGDLYIGAFDLLADVDTSNVATIDLDTAGMHSFQQVDGTAPANYLPITDAGVPDSTFMIRGFGARIPSAGTIDLSWGDARNAAIVPGQDFAVYEGNLASLDGVPDHAPIACGTDGVSRFVVDPEPGDSFFLVSPLRATREGSSGTGTGGSDRTPLSSCRTIRADPCP
jgi:hypothetical protein